MQTNMMCQLSGRIFLHLMDLQDREKRKKVWTEYRAILARAKEIGTKGNPLLTAYTMAAVFIATVRYGGLTPQEACDRLAEGMKSSRLVKMAMGSADSYLSEKRMEGRMKWSEDTYRREYPNNWVVDVLPGNGDYDLGYDYRECGVCKLCRDEGCFEYAKYLCKLDFVLTSLIGLELERTETLAEGGEKCDFRFRRKKKIS